MFRRAGWRVPGRRRESCVGDPEPASRAAEPRAGLRDRAPGNPPHPPRARGGGGRERMGGRNLAHIAHDVFFTGESDVRRSAILAPWSHRVRKTRRFVLTATVVCSRGNGRCSHCHGGGTNLNLASHVPKCPACAGSGVCAMCGGAVYWNRRSRTTAVSRSCSSDVVILCSEGPASSSSAAYAGVRTHVSACYIRRRL